MTNHGFIDPGARERERLERLELLITEALSQLRLKDLSPEVQAIIADLDSGNPQRRHSAQLRMKAEMDADPIDCACGAIEYGAMSQHLVPCPLATTTEGATK